MDARVKHAIHAATGESTEMMMDMYKKYWQPFGLLLTEMEKEGMSVNRYAMPHFVGIQMSLHMTYLNDNDLLCSMLFVGIHVHNHPVCIRGCA